MVWVGLQESQVIGVNAEIFSRDKQNVPMLLGLLEAEPVGVADFHVRYHALQILTGLSSSPHRLQEVPRPSPSPSPLHRLLLLQLHTLVLRALSFIRVASYLL